MLSRTEQSDELQKIFRCALANYWSRKVKPFVRLGGSGVVEIDETKSSTVRGYAGWKHPVFKWILGMICRSTKIMVIYYIKNRRR